MEPETTNNDVLEGTNASILRDLLLEGRGLFLALLAYKDNGGTRSARNDVNAAYESTLSVARTVLLLFLTSRRPEQNKGLKEVDRCFEVWSVAGRDLLFAVLRFLLRR